jgi:hypothetical protein
MNTSEILVDTLLDWGTELVFGLPGDGINGIMEASQAAGDDPLHSSTTRGSRGVHGVRICKAHGKARRLPRDLGPGGIHLLNGLSDANLDKLFADACGRAECRSTSTRRASVFAIPSKSALWVTAAALARGEPNRGQIALTILRDKVRELL